LSEKVSGVICITPTYLFKGCLFEVHNYCGPTPLNKYSNPKSIINDSFWSLYKQFDKLTKEEKEKHRMTNGGCVIF